jgi:Arc/MetJ-type ribon-helix-helix transcriptional regulator/quercetin dioxygenase-like cupin family protein
MKTMPLDLPDDLALEIENLVQAGTFPDAGELTRAALREFLYRHGAQTGTQRAPDESSDPQGDSRTEAYHRRAKLLAEAWNNGATPAGLKALMLPALVAAMRQSHQTSHPSTSMYFAGADVDHPYFLQSDALGVGIAVLPEDAAKALVRKRHPHQVEVIFVLDGALRLHIEAEAPLVLKKGNHFVIGENVCHWITPIENQPGVFVFVKTNPAQEPRGVSCGETVPS